MEKEYIKVLKKDIEDYLEELLDKKIVSKDKWGCYWLEHYSIEDYFIDSWILGQIRDIEDYYMGELNSCELGDKQESIDYIQESIIETIKNNLKEYIDLLKAK